MGVIQHDFKIIQGATFMPRVLFAQDTLVTKAITGITRSARAQVTAPSHGLTIDWQVFVRGAVGMRDINNEDVEDLSAAYYARYVDPNTLKLDVDSSEFSAWTSGGEIVYAPPFDLTGYEARAHLRPSKGSSTVIKAFSTDDGSLVLGGGTGTIDYLMPASETEDLTQLQGVHDLELIAPDGITIRRILEGKFTLSKEVTR